jgi:IS5 family transposase
VRPNERDFHGERRKNDTHASTTDPEALLLKKGSGKEAKLCFLGHVITENRHGLVVATETTQATGTAEREASEAMIERVVRGRRSTLGGDKNYDTAEHVKALRALGVTPHVAQNNRNRRSAIDDRTTTHAGYEISQRKRKQVEQVFGWGKTIGPIRKAKHRGVRRVGWTFTFTQAAYNLVRMRPLLCPT